MVELMEGTQLSMVLHSLERHGMIAMVEPMKEILDFMEDA